MESVSGDLVAEPLDQVESFFLRKAICDRRGELLEEKLVPEKHLREHLVCEECQDGDAVEAVGHATVTGE